MRINKAEKKVDGVLVRGFKNRRLVVNIPTSLEPMAVNVPLVDIRQVAVLPVDPADAEKQRFTVAAQIGVDRWVRLGVFDSATEAEKIIQDVAKAVAGSRWTNVWIMMGMSLVSGFVFVVMGTYFVNSQNGGNPSATSMQGPAVPAAAPVAIAPPPSYVAPAPAVVIPDNTPSASMDSAVAATPAAPAAAGNPVGIQMSTENEAAMRDYFNTKK